MLSHTTTIGLAPVLCERGAGPVFTAPGGFFMAEWKKLAKRALLSDGRIDLKETALIREEIFADARVDKSELEFLFSLRKEAESCVAAFTELFFKAVKDHMLADGVISAAEAKWLRKMIFADGTVDEDEKKLMETLKQEARDVAPEFQKLYDEIMKA
jgi:hypothetical protein